MSWITAFCTRAILLDKGKVVAEGDPEMIADMHEQDAEVRKKQRRKAKQLIKHGKVDIVDLKKARREGTLGEMLEGNEQAAADLEAAAKAGDKLAATGRNADDAEDASSAAENKPKDPAGTA